VHISETWRKKGRPGDPANSPHDAHESRGKRVSSGKSARVITTWKEFEATKYKYRYLDSARFKWWGARAQV